MSNTNPRYEIKDTKEIGNVTICTVRRITPQIIWIYTIISTSEGIDEIVTPAGEIHSLLDNEIPVCLSYTPPSPRD